MLTAAFLAIAAPVLRVGMVAGQSPCSYLDQGIWKGSAVELWNAAAERTKIPFVVQRTDTPKEAVDARVSGKLDVAVSCFNLTHGRLRQVGYTTPYRFEGIKILGKAKEFDLLGILSRAIKDVRLPRAFSLLFGTTLVITIATVILESKLVEAIFRKNYPPRTSPDSGY